MEGRPWDQLQPSRLLQTPPCDRHFGQTPSSHRQARAPPAESRCPLPHPDSSESLPPTAPPRGVAPAGCEALKRAPRAASGGGLVDLPSPPRPGLCVCVRARDCGWVSGCVGAWVGACFPLRRVEGFPARIRYGQRRRGCVSSYKLEIQAEILNRRRYKVITERYCMTHSDTGHQDLTVKSLCDDFSLLSLISSFKFCRCHCGSVHVADVTDYSNADD